MKISVVGAGQMGLSISVSLARFYDINLIARNKEKAEKDLQRSIKTFRRLHREATPSGNAPKIETDFGAIRDSVLIIEAVAESLSVKKEVFSMLSQQAEMEALVATNTSTLSITELSSSVTNPARFFGCHFFNPAYSHPIVEISIGENSDPVRARSLNNILTGAGYSAVMLEEKPGFIVNRALFLMLNEAIEILAEKTAAPEEIDSLFEQALGHPMGPLRLADFIGLDTCEAILRNLYNEFKQDKYRPCPLLTKKVRAGKFGKKSKEGFYRYGR